MEAKHKAQLVELTHQHLELYADRFDAIIATAGDPSPEQLAYLRRVFRLAGGAA